MTVNWYEFGNPLGGVSPSGLPVIPSDASYGPPAAITGTLGALATVIVFAAETKSITIRNTSDTVSLQYSYDGTTWLTLGPWGEQQEPVCTSSLSLRRVTGAPTYEVVAILTT